MSKSYHDAWDKIFAVKQFDTSLNLHRMTFKEAKTITGIDARHLSKFDSTRDMPPILARNGYFILPLSKYEFVLVRGNGFHELEQQGMIKDFTSRVKFNLTTMHRNSSEAQYLDYAHIAGNIEEVIGRGTLYQSIRGREGTGSFDFKVGKIPIQVRSAQIETDLGLEGEDCIVLLEAKSKTPEDFIIRQLYYPYRRFKNLAPEKRIIPVFFTFDAANRSYNYWVYEVVDTADYNSLKLVETHSYTISTAHEITAQDIVPVDTIYKDLVPQANDLDKVLELIFKVKEGMNNAASIAEYFGFKNRQSSYYREAAEALGFVTLEGNTYHLTDAGQHLTGLETQERNLYFSRVISNFKLVKLSLELLKVQGSVNKPDLEKIIAANSNLTGTTPGRRADSLYAWLRWIAVNTGAFIVTPRAISISSVLDIKNAA